MEKSRLKYEAGGIMKPKIRRFLVDCQDDEIIDYWEEKKLNLFDSYFYIYGDLNELVRIKNHLSKYEII